MFARGALVLLSALCVCSAHALDPTAEQAKIIENAIYSSAIDATCGDVTPNPKALEDLRMMAEMPANYLDVADGPIADFVRAKTTAFIEGVNGDLAKLCTPRVPGARPPARILIRGREPKGEEKKIVDTGIEVMAVAAKCPDLEPDYAEVYRLARERNLPRDFLSIGGPFSGDLISYGIKALKFYSRDSKRRCAEAMKTLGPGRKWVLIKPK